MKNIYAGIFKDALSSYYNTAKEINQKKANNLKIYTSEMAKTENARLETQMQKAYEQTKAVINTEYSLIRKKLADATFYRAEHFTDAVKLFESGIKLSPDAVKGYVQEYLQTGNYTMLAYINTWIDKKINSGDKSYIGINIPSPEDCLREYQKLANSALHIANLIRDNKNIMHGEPLELNYFADESCSDIKFDLIGNGNRLRNTEIDLDTPKNMGAVFDNYTLDALSE